MESEKIQNGAEMVVPAAEEAKTLVRLLEELQADFPTQTNALLTLLGNRRINLTAILKRLVNKDQPDEIVKMRVLMYEGIDAADTIAQKSGQEAADAKLKQVVEDIADILKKFQI